MLNPFKVITNVLTTLMTFLLLGWYGMFCFRLGWSVRENPLLSPVAEWVTGNGQKTDKDCHEMLGHRFGACDQ